MALEASDGIIEGARGLLREGFDRDEGPETERLALAIYRALAEGRAVAPADLAARAELSPPAGEAALDRFNPSAIDFDREGSIVAFGGLSLAATDHAFLINGRQLYTWCVFDALFLPEILGAAAVLQTRCPETGAAIHAELSPRALIRMTPESAVMSMVAPDRQDRLDDLRGAFCRHVRFFADRAAIERWAAARTDVAVMAPQAAHDLAHERNQARYPSLQPTA